MRTARWRWRRLSLALVGCCVVLANAPVALSFISAQIHEWEITRPGYERKYGYWQILQFPTKYRVNAVHAALLNTGKVLMMAGSGNNVADFNAGAFKTLEWDPANNHLRLIPTPADVFCGGHAFLADGKLLIAGGTQRYEQLASTLKNAGGAMNLVNSTQQPVTLPKHTVFVAPNGRKYLSDVAITVPGAKTDKVRDRARVAYTYTVPGRNSVWVDAVGAGEASLQAAGSRYSLGGAAGGLTATGAAMTLQKQLFQGTNLAFEFDPIANRYEAVERMTHKRWYPSLIDLTNGNVLAVSGLDGVGNISDGQNEVFNPRTRTWSVGPFRYFPTYPALFLTADGNLFYTSANTGFGPRNKGRTPGVWDLANDTFRSVGGLRDVDAVETAGSILLPPAQSQKVMIIGGGGVGESKLSTKRTAVIALNSSDPHFTPGPNLPHPTRYPLAVILPNDRVFVTGGSRFYRGEQLSNNHDAEIYDPTTNRFTPAAAPSIGRDYHSEALLLPDGRVATFGSNPLFSDQKDTTGAQFEQRVEIYSPPYLFMGPRPRITGGPSGVTRGSAAAFTIPNAGAIAKLRLIHPGAYTHVTDNAQRSVALPFALTTGGVTAQIPQSPGLVPSGWYMLFAVNAKGVPSVARWVKVS